MYEIAVCDDSKKDRERLIQRIKQCSNQKELRIQLQLSMHLYRKEIKAGWHIRRFPNCPQQGKRV